MEIFTLEIGNKIELMEKELIITVMELNTLEIGKKIVNMVLDTKLGLMEHHMKESMSLERKKEQEFLPGKPTVET